MAYLTGIKFIKAESLEQLIPDRVDDDASTFGIQQMSAYRPDLHAELVYLAREEKGLGHPVKIVAKQGVAVADAETGQVTFSDGTHAKADLIVAADGVHSAAGNLLCRPEAPPPLKSGVWSVYRFTLPHAKMLADPDTEQLKPANDHRAYIAASGDNVRWLTWYFCRDKEMCSFALYTKSPVPHGLEALEDSHALRFRASREDLQKEMAGFHPSIRKLADMATELLPIWKCTSREPLEKFHRGRLVAIGDAAHPKLPSMAWGAVTAIEDAGFLRGLFSDIPDSESTDESIAKRLELFSQKRVPRTAAYKLYSDSTLFSDAPKEQNAKVAKWLDINTLPGKSRRPFHRSDICSCFEKRTEVNCLSGLRVTML